MDSPAHHGERIAEARTARKLKQKELAARLGIDQSRLSRVESGELGAIGAVKFQALLKELGLDPSEFGRERPPATQRASACSAWMCPSHLLGRVGAAVVVFARPEVAAQGDERCTCCGNRLRSACETCGAPLTAGAYCGRCGDPYFPTDISKEDLEELGLLKHVKTSLDIQVWLRGS